MGIPSRNEFLENLKRASREVDNWPEWKKEWAEEFIGRPLNRRKNYNEKEFTISEEEFKI